MSQSAEHDIAPIVIETRLEAYQTFFDGAWAGRIFELVDGTKVSEPAGYLCMDWKAAGNAFRLPWVMMRSLESLKNGFVQN